MKKIPKALICVGAPKCGTTWLYHQIEKSGRFNAPATKEVDFWNIYKHSFSSRRRPIKEVPRKVQKIFGFFFSVNYLRNFENDYDPSMPFLDFSPGYMDLSLKQLLHIRENILEPRFLLCTRNPAERVVSHLNYSARLKKFFYLKCFLNGWYYKTKKCRRSTDYSGVYDRLVGVFGEDKVCVIAYEDLVHKTKSCEERLGEFLGEEISLDSGEVINKGEKRVSLTKLKIDKVNYYYRRQLEFWKKTLTY